MRIFRSGKFCEPIVRFRKIALMRKCSQFAACLRLVVGQRDCAGAAKNLLQFDGAALTTFLFSEKNDNLFDIGK